MSTPEAAPLHMCYTQNLTHEHMHTHTVESPDMCFHRHQADSGILNPNNAFCWFYSEACENGGCDGREYVSLAEATPGLLGTVSNSLIPTDYTNENLDRMVLGSPSVG